ncbi:MAG: ABC transporter permease [bacterium]
MFLHKFKQNKLALFGIVIIFAMFFVGIFAPVLSPYNPNRINVDDIFLSPFQNNHILGTDGLGRDVLSRIIWGTRVSIKVGFVATGISIIIGILIGSIAGYYGRMVDSVLMRFVDMMLCFPSFFLILSVVAITKPCITNIMIIIGLTSWMGIARLVRGEFLSLKEREFTQAAKIMGASNMRIIFRHILPNAMAPVYVAATFGIAGAILTESALSFLGLGVQPPTSSWGNLLSTGKSTIEFAWWITAFPGLAILITVLSYNLLGEGLRDILDPRLDT